MAQSAKCLQYKHEDLGSDPQCLGVKLGLVLRREYNREGALAISQIYRLHVQ